MLRVGSKQKVRLNSQDKSHKYFGIKYSRTDFNDNQPYFNGFLSLKSGDLASMLELANTSGNRDLGPHVNRSLIWARRAWRWTIFMKTMTTYDHFLSETNLFGERIRKDLCQVHCDFFGPIVVVVWFILIVYSIDIRWFPCKKHHTCIHYLNSRATLEIIRRKIKRKAHLNIEWII